MSIQIKPPEADAARMGMLSIEVSEATDQALAWMKAKAEGRLVERDFHLNGHHMPGWWVSTKISNAWMTLDDYKTASTRLLGSLISREGLAVRRSKGTWYAIRSDDLGDGERAQWTKYTFRDAHRTGPMSYDVQSRQQRFEGPTLEVAATRCFVASKLGPRVDVPLDLAGAPREAVNNANVLEDDDDEQAEANAPAP